MEDLAAQRPPSATRWALILILVFATARLVWLTDVSFLVDQAHMLERALDDNLHHAFTTHGIEGSRGHAYGPLAIWFDRALIAIKPDVVFLVFERTVIVTAITAIALLWLQSTCVFLVPQVAVIPFLSPYLWYWARDPWDNTLLIPLVALALASYLAFHESGERWKLGITVASLTACFVLHLMSLPVIGAIALHFALFHRHWLQRHWRWAAIATFAALGVATPYLLEIPHLTMGGIGDAGPVTAIGFSLSAPLELSALGFERYLGSSWFMTGSAAFAFVSVIAIAITGAAFAFCWWGLAIAIRTVWRGRRSPADREALRYHLCFLVVVGFALHVVINIAMRLSGFPHYYNGVWILFFAMMWIAASEAWTLTLVRRALILYAVCLAFSLVRIVARLHEHGGSREMSYGPTLANWIELARRTPQNAVIQSDAFHPRVFPNIIPTLQRLYPSEVAGDHAILRYVRPEDRWDGRIEAVMANDADTSAARAR